MKKYLLLVLLACYINSISSSQKSIQDMANETRIKIEAVEERQRELNLIKLSRMRLVEAMIHVESRNSPLAYNKKEEAAGVLQIRPIMIREVNRVVGYAKYSLSDRWNRESSIKIFMDIQAYHNPEWDLEKAARIWNGGPNGMNKSSTAFYWSLVKSKMEDLKF